MLSNASVSLVLLCVEPFNSFLIFIHTSFTSLLWTMVIQLSSEQQNLLPLFNCDWVTVSQPPTLASHPPSFPSSGNYHYGLLIHSFSASHLMCVFTLHCCDRLISTMAKEEGFVLSHEFGGLSLWYLGLFALGFSQGRMNIMTGKATLQ